MEYYTLCQAAATSRRHDADRIIKGCPRSVVDDVGEGGECPFKDIATWRSDAESL